MSQNINAPSATVLDINATDEIELNATLVDVNANLEISGTATTTGVHTFTAVPVFPNNTVETADIQANAVTGAKLNNDVISAQTALAEQPASADEIMISDGGTLKRLDFDHIFSTPSFYAYQAATQAIGNGSLTKVTLGTEGWDTDSAFTDSKWTPGVIGKYFIAGAAAMINMTTNSYFELKFYKNGSEIPGRNGNQRIHMASTAASDMSQTSSFIIELDADDYIEMYVVQDNADGGGGSRTLGDAANLAYMSGFKIVGI